LNRASQVRRASPVTAIAAIIALMGCSAGQVTQTASGASSVYGLNTENEDGSVLIRNLAVSYDGTAGYPAGATSPLELHLFNQTEDPVTVSISSRPSDAPKAGADIVSAGSVTLTGTTPPPTPPAEGSSARFAIEPLGFVSFRPGSAAELHAVGLTGRLAPGEFLNLVFEFSNGAAPLLVRAPMATPMSPAARVPGDLAGHNAD
jgi:hypothetical protein